MFNGWIYLLPVKFGVGVSGLSRQRSRLHPGRGGGREIDEANRGPQAKTLLVPGAHHHSRPRRLPPVRGPRKRCAHPGTTSIWIALASRRDGTSGGSSRRAELVPVRVVAFSPRYANSTAIPAPRSSLLLTVVRRSNKSVMVFEGFR